MSNTEFDKSGGIGLLGYVSPMDTRDSYAVTDPVYGIDGLRNVATVNELNTIPFERRRAGMIVGVGGGENYYKLKNISNWIYDISDWDELNLKQNYSDKEIPVGSIDGVNTRFELLYSPQNGSDHLYLNGMLQESGEGTDYTVKGNIVTFGLAPEHGDRIRCSYRYKNL